MMSDSAGKQQKEQQELLKIKIAEIRAALLNANTPEKLRELKEQLAFIIGFAKNAGLAVDFSIEKEIDLKEKQVLSNIERARSSMLDKASISSAIEDEQGIGEDTYIDLDNLIKQASELNDLYDHSLVSYIVQIDFDAIEEDSKEVDMIAFERIIRHFVSEDEFEARKQLREQYEGLEKNRADLHRVGAKRHLDAAEIEKERDILVQKQRKIMLERRELAKLIKISEGEKRESLEAQYRELGDLSKKIRFSIIKSERDLDQKNIDLAQISDAHVMHDKKEKERGEMISRIEKADKERLEIQERQAYLRRHDLDKISVGVEREQVSEEILRIEESKQKLMDTKTPVGSSKARLEAYQQEKKASVTRKQSVEENRAALKLQALLKKHKRNKHAGVFKHFIKQTEQHEKIATPISPNPTPYMKGKGKTSGGVTK